jgi:hypothetical protein
VTEDEPTADDLQNPEYLRARAEEIRDKANAMGSPQLRESMLQIALEYDRLAEWVHARAPTAAPARRRVPNGTDSP